MKYLIQKNKASITTFVSLDLDLNSFNLVIDPDGATIFNSKKQAKKSLELIPYSDYYTIIKKVDADVLFKLELEEHLTLKRNLNLLDPSFSSYDESMSKNDVLKFYINHTTKTIEKGSNCVSFETYASYPHLISLFSHIYSLSGFDDICNGTHEIIPEIHFKINKEHSFSAFKEEVNNLLSLLKENKYFKNKIHLISLNECFSDPYLTVLVKDENTLSHLNIDYTFEEFFNYFSKQENSSD